LGAGIIAILAYFVFLCSRAGCACCIKEARCGPNLSRVVLVLLSAAMVSLTLLSYVGYVSFINGVSGVALSVLSIQTTVATLNTHAGTLAKQGTTYVTDAAKVGCSQWMNKQLKQSATIFSVNSQIYSIALPNPSALTSVVNLFSTQLPEYIMYLLGFAAAIAVVTFMFSFTGTALKSSALLNFSSLTGLLLFLILIALSSIELSLSVMFADFCANGPDKVLHNMAVNTLNKHSVGVVDYYTTCTGTNPLEVYLNKTIHQIDIIANTTSWELSMGCTDPATVRQMHAQALVSELTAASIFSLQTCDNIFLTYDDLTTNILCGSTVTGLFELWTAHIAAAGILFITLFFTSFVKQKCKVKDSSRNYFFDFWS
jgi:hypothetical protein